MSSPSAPKLEVEVIPSESRPPDKRFAKLPRNEDLLFKPPFTLTAVGMIGSGKSSAVWTLFDKWYRNYFDQLVVYCGTPDSNETWKKCHQRQVCVLNSYKETEFRKWLDDWETEQQMRRQMKNKLARVAVMFDDMAGDNILSSHASTALERLFLTCRHYNITMVLCTQHWKKVSMAARSNMFHYMLLQVPRRQAEMIMQDIAQGVPWRNLLEFYEEVMKEKYRFLIYSPADTAERRLRVGMNQFVDMRELEDEDSSTASGEEEESSSSSDGGGSVASQAPRTTKRKREGSS